VFAAGDTVRGASLVVHAINQGRQCAAACHKWLT
jgi:glutamate synthase (NADPH) small chain